MNDFIRASSLEQLALCLEEDGYTGFSYDLLAAKDRSEQALRARKAADYIENDTEGAYQDDFTDSLIKDLRTWATVRELRLDNE